MSDSQSTLRDLIEHGGRLTSDELVFRFEPVLVCLAELHARGLAYGAVSSDTLIFGSDETLRLASSTPHPTATPQDDVLAMGTVLYEALTGRPPFPAPTEDTGAGTVVPPRTPALPALERRYPSALRTVVSRAQSPLPSRHPDAQALLADLRVALGAGPDPTESNSRAGFSRRWQLRERAVPALAVCGVAVALVLGFATLRRSPDAVWLEGQVLPQLQDHIESGNLHEATRLYETAANRMPESVQLEALAPAIFASVRVISRPAGAVLDTRRVADQQGWTTLGETPLTTRLPRVELVLRFQLGGHETVERTLTEHIRPGGSSEPLEVEVELSRLP